VLQLYAGTNKDDPKKRGWLRDVPARDVQRWAKEFLDFVRAKNPDLPAAIRQKLELTNDIKATLNRALAEFNDIFQA
jgi:F-type H+-transporting ATPase subunit alpha